MVLPRFPCLLDGTYGVSPRWTFLCVCLSFLLCKTHVSHLLHKVAMRMNHPAFTFQKLFLITSLCTCVLGIKLRSSARVVHALTSEPSLQSSALRS